LIGILPAMRAMSGTVLTRYIWAPMRSLRRHRRYWPGWAREKGVKAKLGSALGQPISLPATLDNADRTEIAKVFGEQFADALGAQKPGGWTGAGGLGLRQPSGPHSSGKGRVGAQAGRRSGNRSKMTGAPRRWRRAKAQAYQTLLDGYTIRIAKP
jgi:hypothetical protein